MPNRAYPPETIDRICEQLEEGKSLILICKQDGMPNRRTVQGWAEGNDDIATRIREARELGYHYRAEMAVAAAKNAIDPHAGRLAFDAERWYLGKLSNAFRDKPVVGVNVNVAGDDALAAVQGVLDRAAATISGGSHSTKQVALPSPAGPGDAGGDGLADMDGAGGERLGEDPDGR